jgi:hypothetical protein
VFADNDNTTVAITLVDINDNSPIFVEDHYYFNVNDSKTGDIVGVVSETFKTTAI